MCMPLRPSPSFLPVLHAPDRHRHAVDLHRRTSGPFPDKVGAGPSPGPAVPEWRILDLCLDFVPACEEVRAVLTVRKDWIPAFIRFSHQIVCVRLSHVGAVAGGG